jgi:hypothetical protein
MAITYAEGRTEVVSYDGGRRGEMTAARQAVTGEDGVGARASDARR